MIDAELRLSGITATDLPAICGVDPRRDGYAIYAAKKGLLERPPVTPQMKLGKKVERAIIECYSELTGRETTFLDVTLEHARRTWMKGTPDAICTLEPRGVEAKFFVHWRGEEIPPAAELQCRWYMALLDYPLWDIIIANGGEPVIETIERDLEFEQYLIEKAEEFYRRYIVGNEEPPMGGSEESARYLRQHFPRHRLAIRKATEDEIILLERYAQVRDDLILPLGEKAELENQIKYAIKDGEGLEWRRGKFTWKNVKDSTRTDWQSLGESLLKDCPAEERDALIARHSRTVPGVRKIYFRCEQEEDS